MIVQKIVNVYLLDDKAWIIAETDWDTQQLYVASHREAPILVTAAMNKRGDVPQEVIEWYKG